MTEPTQKNAAANNQPSEQDDRDDRLIDPLDLVYSGGYRGNPRELVENPAVTPEMLDQAPEDLRPDLIEDDENGED